MGPTQEIAGYVAKARYRDIPSDVVQLARGFILDGIGVALVGSTVAVIERKAGIAQFHDPKCVTKKLLN